MQKTILRAKDTFNFNLSQLYIVNIGTKAQRDEVNYTGSDTHSY